MKEKLSPLVDAMSRKEFYPHRPAEVEVRQTHISYVFLAGPYVYKIKKPVRFPFLDYSTLQKRQHFCREEVRLNRRLAPETYLDVIGVCRSNTGFALTENLPADDRVIEYAVKMKRLPEDRMLSFLVRQEVAVPSLMLAIAKKLASFHEMASVENSRLYGSLDAIAANIRGNFEETRRFIDRTISLKLFERIREYNETFFRENADLFARRISEGRVREGHGDLRAEHICLVDDIVIFDCVEFDEGLRYGDVASEIGFLSMDLDFLGAADPAAELEVAYASAARDPALAALLPFYKCYRAYVRGKVESLKSEEREIADEGRRKASLQALRYFCLSSRYIKPENRPLLLVVCGMIATGKSTLAWLLAALTGFPVVDSDRVRKKLAGIPATARAGEEYQRGIYSAEFTQLTYEALLISAEKQLASGKGVIVDATFGDRKHRRLFLNRAGSLKIPVIFLECRADENSIRRRLEERAKSVREASDGTWEIYQRMRRDFHPLSEIPQEHHLPIDTEHALLHDLDRIEELL